MNDIINKIIRFNEIWSDPEYRLRAVKEDDRLIRYVRKPTPEMCLIAIKQDSDNCDFIMLPESEYELETFVFQLISLLRQNSNYTIKFIIGLINRMLDRYVAYSDPAVCLKLVKQYGYVIRFITKQTPEICVEAIKQNPDVYEYIRLPDTESKREKFIKKLRFLLIPL